MGLGGLEVVCGGGVGVGRGVGRQQGEGSRGVVPVSVCRLPSGPVPGGRWLLSRTGSRGHGSSRMLDGSGGLVELPAVEVAKSR